MFQVSDAAQAEIASYFADKELKPLRVFLHPGGCAGPELLMALDEKKDGDDIYKINGVEFVIEKPLLNEVQPLKIDFAETGFTIESSLKSEDGCSGCCGGCGA
jgi:Fe-S cluster assembly iron-binding protein IscA